MTQAEYQRAPSETAEQPLILSSSSSSISKLGSLLVKRIMEQTVPYIWEPLFMGMRPDVLTLLTLLIKK